jgi:hypothetical protein
MGTACSSTSKSTRSSTTSCGTSTCIKRSKRSGCNASTTSACLYSRKYTARRSTLCAHRAKPRVVFQSLKRLALDLPSRAVTDVLRTCPDSTGMSSRHRSPTLCLEISLLGGGLWKDGCQPFRMPPSGSQVRYIMDVMNLIISAHFLFLLLRELPVCKRESLHSGGYARAFRGAS